MRSTASRWAFVGACALAVASSAAVAAPAPPKRHHPVGAAAATPIPRVVRVGDHAALYVDGAPYTVLAAQANNSSNWPDELPKVWSAIDQLRPNTLEMPIAWEQLEPSEGRFDFSFLDMLLTQARAHHVHLVLLWFGTWKNSHPTYAPAWVKLDNAPLPPRGDHHRRDG